MTVAQPSFDDVRREAYRLLGDAADQIRYIDAPTTDRQKRLMRQALGHIAAAKTAINEAAGRQ